MLKLKTNLYSTIKSNKFNKWLCFSVNRNLIIHRIHSRISLQLLAQFWRSSCGGRLIRGSCHTARVNSQHDGYLSATLTVCEPHMAWTISRSLGLRGCVGESKSAGYEWPRTDLCCCCIASHCNLTQVTLLRLFIFGDTTILLPAKLTSVCWLMGVEFCLLF